MYSIIPHKISKVMMMVVFNKHCGISAWSPKDCGCQEYMSQAEPNNPSLRCTV